MKPYIVTVQTTQHIEVFAESENGAKEAAAERAVGVNVETIEIRSFYGDCTVSPLVFGGRLICTTSQELVNYLDADDPNGDCCDLPFGAQVETGEHPDDDVDRMVKWVICQNGPSAFYDDDGKWRTRGGSEAEEE